MIVYDNRTGEILCLLERMQKVDFYFRYYPETFKNNLATMKINEVPEDIIYNYKIINNELVKMTDLEKSEIRKYGKILTEEERQLQKLKPSPEEVKKAEQTIEILTLLQEVM